MGIKSWWKSMNPAEKVLSILGITSTAASLYVCGDAIYHMNRIREETLEAVDKGLDDLKVTVNLIPKDYKPTYDKLKKIWDNSGAISMDELFDDNVDPNTKLIAMPEEQYENMRQDLLDLIWDKAEEENKLEAANDEVPSQLHD